MGPAEAMGCTPVGAVVSGHSKSAGPGKEGINGACQEERVHAGRGGRRWPVGFCQGVDRGEDVGPADEIDSMPAGAAASRQFGSVMAWAGGKTVGHAKKNGCTPAGAAATGHSRPDNECAGRKNWGTSRGRSSFRRGQRPLPSRSLPGCGQGGACGARQEERVHAGRVGGRSPVGVCQGVDRGENVGPAEEIGCTQPGEMTSHQLGSIRAGEGGKQ